MKHPDTSKASAPPPTPSTQSSAVSTPSIATSSTSSFKFFSSAPKPDPDKEDIVWHEPETHSAVISRKEHPRDPTLLLSLRDVLRNKASVDGPSALTPSTFMNLGSTASRMATGVAPPSAWANPAVEFSQQAAEGYVSGMPDAGETAGRILSEIDAASLVSKDGSEFGNSGFLETHI